MTAQLGSVPPGVIDPERHPEWFEREAFGYADWLLQEILAAQRRQEQALSAIAQATAALAAAGPSASQLAAALTVAFGQLPQLGQPQLTIWESARGSTDQVVQAAIPGQLSELPNFSAGVIGQLTSSRLVWLTGANQADPRIVSSLNAGGVLTLDSPLPNFPVIGDRFVLISPTSLSSAVTVSENIASVGGTAQTGANWSALFSVPDTAAAFAAVSVGTVATQLDPTPPANRRLILVVNNGTSAIFVGFGSGADTVTAATGIPVAAGGGSMQANLGPALPVYAISTAAQDVRVLQAA